MATKRPWRTAVLFAACWLAGWSAITAQASEIRDEAGLFSPAVVASTTDSLKQLEARNHLSVTIETHSTIPADRQAAFSKLTVGQRPAFFEKWALDRARATSAHGLFVLIVKQPGYVESLASPKLKEQGFTKLAKESFDSKLLENFKEKKFDQGLESAASYLNVVAPKLIHSNRSLASQRAHHPVSAPAHGEQPMGQVNRGWGIWGWVILAVVTLMVFSVVSALVRGFSGGGAGPGYGTPGYGYGGGGGGFMSNMLGGLAGAVAGNWIYNSMFGSHNSAYGSSGWTNSGNDSGTDDLMGNGGASDDFSGGGYDASGGSFGDFGGGDFGGGDFGGGDF